MKQVFVADTHFGHDKFHSENWEYKFWKKYNNINQDFMNYIEQEKYIVGEMEQVSNNEKSII